MIINLFDEETKSWKVFETEKMIVVPEDDGRRLTIRDEDGGITVTSIDGDITVRPAYVNKVCIETSI